MRNDRPNPASLVENPLIILVYGGSEKENITVLTVIVWLVTQFVFANKV
jgi:hypothetical protein